MKDEELIGLKERTREFSLRIIRLYSALPKTTEAQVLGKQLLRSATSVGAHYREGSRSRSDAEFISKLQVGIQEMEESMYWMELLPHSGILSSPQLSSLQDEANQLQAILVTCVKKVKNRRPV